MRRLPRELANYQREAKAAGWRFKQLAHGELWLPPEGEAITLHYEHGRSQDRTTVTNITRRLRRAGLTGRGKS